MNGVIERKVQNLCLSCGYSTIFYILEETDEVSGMKLIIEQAEEAMKRVADSYRKKDEATIIFSHEGEKIVKIEIWNVFEAKIAFDEKLYTLRLEPNEHYDGYHDTAEDVIIYTPTDKLKDIASEMQDSLKKIWPDLSVRIR